MMHRCFDVNVWWAYFDVRVTFLALEMSEMKWVGMGRPVETLAGQVLLARLQFYVSWANFGIQTVGVSPLVGRMVNRDCFCLMEWEAGCYWKMGLAASSDGKIGLARKTAQTRLFVPAV